MNNSLLSRDPNNKPLIKFHAYKYDLSSYFESVRWFVRSPESRLKLAQTSVKFVAFRRNFSRNFKNPLFPSLSSPRCQLEIIFSLRKGDYDFNWAGRQDPTRRDSPINFSWIIGRLFHARDLHETLFCRRLFQPDHSQTPRNDSIKARGL